MTDEARRAGFLEALTSGRIRPPACAVTLGLEIIAYDPETRSIRLSFQGRPEFANPIGNVQGGFLSAMLDDAMGLASACELGEGEFAPTLGLSVQFHRPAAIGPLVGIGRVVTRGSTVCQLAGELFQNDRMVASATATAIIRKT
jgi:uncharacterized protein (TIGR00369 family)